jgi:hypothetical protein
MALTMIDQARYGVGLATPCGTEGLGPCVGVASFHGKGWFIAHIECAESRFHVPGVAHEVAEYVTDKLATILGNCESVVHVATSSLTEKSAAAVIEGVKDWAENMDVRAWEANGLLVTGGVSVSSADGEPVTLRLINIKSATYVPGAKSLKDAAVKSLVKFGETKAQQGDASFKVPMFNGIIGPAPR